MGWSKLYPKNMFFTPEGGLAIRMKNKTGGLSIKGYVLEVNPAENNSVKHTDTNDIDPMGITYESGISDGEFMWVVVSGKAYVYYGGSVNLGTISRVSITSDGYAAGQAKNEALPTPPFATDNHFREIGHPVESRTGAGLALTNLHFN